VHGRPLTSKPLSRKEGQGKQPRSGLETYQRAESLAAAGKPAALMEVQTPLPYVITAAGYVEKYGPDERYNFLKFLSAVRCPTLITLGGQEVQGNMAFQGLPGDLDSLAALRKLCQIHVVAGADHFYTGRRTELLDDVDRWLQGISTMRRPLP
jgi:hypothetical protein